MWICVWVYWRIEGCIGVLQACFYLSVHVLMHVYSYIITNICIYLDMYFDKEKYSSFSSFILLFYTFLFFRFLLDIYGQCYIWYSPFFLVYFNHFPLLLFVLFFLLFCFITLFFIRHLWPALSVILPVLLFICPWDYINQLCYGVQRNGFKQRWVINCW